MPISHEPCRKFSVVKTGLSCTLIGQSHNWRTGLLSTGEDQLLLNKIDYETNYDLRNEIKFHYEE